MGNQHWESLIITVAVSLLLGFQIPGQLWVLFYQKHFYHNVGRIQNSYFILTSTITNRSKWPCQEVTLCIGQSAFQCVPVSSEFCASPYKAVRRCVLLPVPQHHCHLWAYFRMAVWASAGATIKGPVLYQQPPHPHLAECSVEVCFELPNYPPLPLILSLSILSPSSRLPYTLPECSLPAKPVLVALVKLVHRELGTWWRTLVLLLWIWNLEVKSAWLMDIFMALGPGISCLPWVVRLLVTNLKCAGLPLMMI